MYIVGSMIRNTRQRQAIQEAFMASSRPLGPLEVLEAGRRRLRGLGIATVYRTVKSLVAEGWLVEVELPGQPSRYEVAEASAHHHHFLCRKCDRVYDLKGCPGSVKSVTPPRFRVEGHDLVVYGVCAPCMGSA